MINRTLYPAFVLLLCLLSAFYSVTSDNKKLEKQSEDSNHYFLPKQNLRVDLGSLLAPMLSNQEGKNE
jgi:hypothetical protein